MDIDLEERVAALERAVADMRAHALAFDMVVVTLLRRSPLSEAELRASDGLMALLQSGVAPAGPAGTALLDAIQGYLDHWEILSRPD